MLHALDPSLVLGGAINDRLHLTLNFRWDHARLARVREAVAHLGKQLEVSDSGTVSAGDKWLAVSHALLNNTALLLPEAQVLL